MTGTHKLAAAFTALSLAAFASIGGDKPRDRRLEPLPVAELCPRLRDGHWLRAVVVQENYLHFRYHDCYFGLNAELERRWLGLP